MKLLPLLSLSKTFQLMLLYFLLVGLHYPSVADPPYPSCTNKANYTVNSTFHSNLINLFDSLSSTASISGFYDAIVGNDTDRVYGLFLCLGFVSQRVCKACVYTAIQDIERLCRYSKEATVWEEYCQLSYSNQNFLGYVNDTTFYYQINLKNITDPVNYSLAVKKLMGELSERASNNSTKMYVVGGGNYTQSNKIYGLVQCTRDLSENNCDRCLQNEIKEILSCCYFSSGAKLMSKSCYLMYELYDFYEGPSESTPSPRTSSVPTSKGDQKKLKKLKLILATVSAFLSLILFGFCIYRFVASKRLLQGRDSNIVQDVPLLQTGADRDKKMEAQDFPLISLATIHSATNNFSNLNMLGRGGFGPVYKL